MSENMKKNKNNYAINRLFFLRLYRLCKPFWVSPASRLCRLLFVVTLVIPLIYSSSGGYFSFKTAEMTNALVARQEEVYWLLLIVITALGVLRNLTLTLSTYLSNIVNLKWRVWLTEYLFAIYLTDRTYYRITQDESVDNPDQRLQEEIAPLCKTLSEIPAMLFTASLDIFVQGYILMSISTTMLLTVIAYAIFNTLATLLLFRPMIKQQYDITVSEADLRYSLLQVRDNDESIAFYNGEAISAQNITHKLASVVAFFKRQYHYTLKANVGFISLNILWMVLPVVIITPLYFAGKIQYGVIAQATASAAMLLSSLSLIQRYIPQLTTAAPGIVRLAEIQEKMAEVQAEKHIAPDVPEPKIQYQQAEILAIDDLCLTTPGGEQQLVQHLTLTVEQGEHLIIVGRTGTGKSSLLRALAGLWGRGRGTVRMPQERLFLPQTPYLTQGNLREQLIYPQQSTDMTDEDLLAVLDNVNLRATSEKYGGLDSIRPWRDQLSLGEQQRIGIARVLINKPRYVFLDESTSAVDEQTQEKLYQYLLDSGVTLISVGHRPSIVRYHKRVLHLLAHGEWRVFSARDPVATEFFDL